MESGTIYSSTLETAARHVAQARADTTSMVTCLPLDSLCDVYTDLRRFGPRGLQASSAPSGLEMMGARAVESRRRYHPGVLRKLVSVIRDRPLSVRVPKEPC